MNVIIVRLRFRPRLASAIWGIDVPECVSRSSFAEVVTSVYEKLYRAYSPRGRKSKVDPRVMFKVMVYGYQCGIYSSRKLEEACKYRIDFKWLLEDREEPDHSTFARFRTGRCGEAVEDLFYQYVKLLEKQEETDHKTVFVDGTKLESRAGRYTFCWRGSVEKQLNRVREKVFQLTGRKKRQALQEYLAQQREHIAFVHGKGKHKSEEQRRWEDLDALCKRWAEYEDSLKIMGEARNSYSKTDPDATFMRMKDDHNMMSGQPGRRTCARCCPSETGQYVAGPCTARPRSGQDPQNPDALLGCYS